MSLPRLLSVLGALAFLTGCGSSEAQNVLLITLDTTRADRLGKAGYEPAGTPVLDALADRGVFFSRAYTTAPITLPAHVSILTGTYPPFHGVRDNRRYRASPELETLAEVLQGAGFRTAAFIAAYPLDQQYGLGQGFEHYDDDTESDGSFNPTDFHFPERPAGAVVDSAGEWLDSLSSRERFFAWVHLFDPHADYQAPGEIGERFADDPYQGEIAYMDQQIGRLLDRLESSGRLSDTLVVVVGDHGEGLSDHDESTHSVYIYDSTMRVPLMLAGPGVPGSAVVESTCSVVDVVPTVTEACGLPTPKDVQGTSLRALWEGEEPEPRAVYLESRVPELIYGWSPLEGIVVGGDKLIHAPEAGESELFDTRTDPGEQEDRGDREPARVGEMRARLDRMRELLTPRRSLDAHADVTAAGLQKLQQLGYLGAATKDPAEAGRHPKEMAQVLAGIDRAMTMIQKRRFRRALALLDELEKLDPTGVRHLELRGLAARELGRTEREYFDVAIEALTEALRRNPSSATSWLTLSEVHLAMGNHDEARQCRQEAFRSASKRSSADTGR